MPAELAPARFVEVDPELKAAGVRYVEVSLGNHGASSETVKLGNVDARESASGASLAIAEEGPVPDGYRFVVRVPTRVDRFYAKVSVSCTLNAQDSVSVSVGIDGDMLSSEVY